MTLYFSNNFFLLNWSDKIFKHLTINLFLFLNLLRALIDKKNELRKSFLILPKTNLRYKPDPFQRSLNDALLQDS